MFSMTQYQPETRDAVEDLVFSTANEMLQRAVCALGDMVQRIEAGEVPVEKETKEVIRDIDQATHHMLKERQRLDERQAKQIGAAAGGCVAIDFDAARAEVGRRLACLRAAGSAGSVS